MHRRSRAADLRPPSHVMKFHVIVYDTVGTRAALEQDMEAAGSPGLPRDIILRSFELFATKVRPRFAAA